MARFFWKPTPQPPRFVSEAIDPAGLSRRGLLAGACACCAALASGTAAGIGPVLAQAPAVQA
uniref:twin-arginine translocation signal domain-containing protein n=1 Tax=Acinetobacter baumannii TaxID=470 RepID=UPI001C086E71